MGIIIGIKEKPFIKRWQHKLFNCPTFWRSFWDKRHGYNCPKCNKFLRCYWDGNDIEKYGIDICNKCAKLIEKRVNKTNKPNIAEVV